MKRIPFAHRTFLVHTLILVTALVSTSPVFAALNAYMTAEGALQGLIEGDVEQAGREGTMEVLKYSLSTNTPYDPATGLPIADNQFRPIRVLKRVDDSSPDFVQAMVDEENLTSVTIKFYRPANSGVEEHFYTVELINAKVVGITQFQDSIGEGVSLPKLEWVELTFQKMLQTFEPDSRSAEDNWSTPTN